jgi:hypothetical protein
MTFLDPANFTVVAGQMVVDAIRNERERVVRPSKTYPGLNDSESLCDHQRSVAARGVIGAEIVATIKGWSLRYDSGLQNWGLIRPGLATFDEALAAAKAWTAADPTRRYAWVRNSSCETVDWSPAPGYGTPRA